MDDIINIVVTQMLEAYLGSFIECIEGNNVSINLPGQRATISVRPSQERSQILVTVAYQDSDPCVSEITELTIVIPQIPLVLDAISSIVSNMVRACRVILANLKKVSSFCTYSFHLF